VLRRKRGFFFVFWKDLRGVPFQNRTNFANFFALRFRFFDGDDGDGAKIPPLLLSLFFCFLAPAVAEEDGCFWIFFAQVDLT
jgi:hypothetical protein